MSSATPLPAPGSPADPTSATTEELVGRYREYAQAQRAVDAMADADFPVGAARIVGRDVTIDEDVTGKMSKGRAAGLGAASGAWFGLFIGLLIGLFAVVGWFSLIITAVLIGAFWGAVLGFVGHWATRGRRDFSSTRGLAAGSYEVYVQAGLGDRARVIVAGI